MARSDAPLRLLDVNVLIALSLPNHVHHGLVSRALCRSTYAPALISVWHCFFLLVPARSQMAGGRSFRRF